jgi:hypothetical protein
MIVWMIDHRNGRFMLAPKLLWEPQPAQVGYRRVVQGWRAGEILPGFWIAVARPRFVEKWGKRIYKLAREDGRPLRLTIDPSYEFDSYEIYDNVQFPDIPAIYLLRKPESFFDLIVETDMSDKTKPLPSEMLQAPVIVENAEGKEIVIMQFRAWNPESRPGWKARFRWPELLRVQLGEKLLWETRSPIAVAYKLEAKGRI